MCKIKSTILKEDESIDFGYRKEDLEAITPAFKCDIRKSASSTKAVDIVGVIDEAEYVDGEGIVVEGTIYNEGVAEKLAFDGVDIAPALVVDQATVRLYDVDSVFITTYSVSVVGPTEVVG